MKTDERYVANFAEGREVNSFPGARNTLFGMKRVIRGFSEVKFVIALVEGAQAPKKRKRVIESLSVAIVMI